jgi:hypothetical protein
MQTSNATKTEVVIIHAVLNIPPKKLEAYYEVKNKAKLPTHINLQIYPF